MKRRKFIGASLLGMAGLSCSPEKKPGELNEPGPEKKVPEYKSRPLQTGNRILGANEKIVLSQIGAGGWGSNLALQTAGLNANVEFKYVCDVDDTRGGRAIAELGKIQGFDPERVRDMRKVFDDPDVDAVIIATPTHWHTLAALRAMQAGKDVYLEKCITHNIREGQLLSLAASRNGRILQCGLQNRSAAYNHEAAELIREGKLGKVVNVCINGFLNGPVPLNEKPEEAPPDYIDWDMWLGPAPSAPYSVSRNKSWHYYWDYSAGMCVEDGIHQTDLMRFVMGNPGMPKSVTCSGGRLSVDDERQVPDVLNAVYDFGDFTVNLQAGEFCTYMIKTSPEIRYGDTFPEWTTNSSKVIIQGTEAMMVLGRMGGGWQIFGNEGELIDERPGRFPLQDNLQNYLDCIRTRNVPNANIVHGHMSSSMLHLANMSIRLGNVRLEIDQDTESLLNNAEADRLATGKYRSGYELPEIT